MLRATVLACSSCHNQNHCEECSTYSNSPIAFKAIISKRFTKPSTYKRTAGILANLTIENYSACVNCDSKSCFGCTMYNTQFIKER